MNPNNPPPAAPPPAPAPPAPAPPAKKRRWVLYGCGTILALLVLIVATVFITVWWIQRPIKPVVLSSKEKAVVDEKLRLANRNAPSAPASQPPRSSLAPDNSLPLPGRGGEGREVPLPPKQPENRYVPGSKTITLTEREVNGLLNENTDLGKTVRLEFDKDAINAYIAVPIPKDFPVGGGRTFRARARFGVSIGSEGTPYARLDDVTVLGLSLPKDWLGGIKGQNLLESATGSANGKPVLRGIKSLRVEPGALVLEVQD